MPSYPRAAVLPSDRPDTPLDSPSSPLRILPLLSLSFVIIILLFFSVRLFKRTLRFPNFKWLRGKGQGAKNRLGFELLPTSVKAIPTPSSSPYAIAFNLASPGTTSLATKPLLQRSPSFDSLSQYSPHSPTHPTRPPRSRSSFKLPFLFKSQTNRRSKSLGGVPIRHVSPKSASAPSTPQPPLIDFSTSSSSHTTSTSATSSDLGTHRVSFHSPGPAPLLPGIPIPIRDDVSSRFVDPLSPEGTAPHMPNIWAFDLGGNTSASSTTLGRATSSPVKRPYSQPLIQFSDADNQGDLIGLIPLSEKPALAADTVMHDTLIPISPSPEVEVDVGADLSIRNTSTNVLIQLEESRSPADQVLISLDVEESPPVVSIGSPVPHSPAVPWSHSWSTWDDSVSLAPSSRSHTSAAADPALLISIDTQAEDEIKLARLDATFAQTGFEILPNILDPSPGKADGNPFADPEVPVYLVDAAELEVVKNEGNLVVEDDTPTALLSYTRGEDRGEQDPDLEETWFVQEPRFVSDDAQAEAGSEFPSGVENDLLRFETFADMPEEETVQVIEEEVEVAKPVLLSVEQMEKVDMQRSVMQLGKDEEKAMAAHDLQEDDEEEKEWQGAFEEVAQSIEPPESTDSPPDPVYLLPILVAPAARVSTDMSTLAVSLSYNDSISCPPSLSCSPISPGLSLQTPTPPASPPPPQSRSRSRPRTPLAVRAPSPMLLSPKLDSTIFPASSISSENTSRDRIQDPGELLCAPISGTRTRPHSRSASPVLGMHPRPLWSVRAADAPPLGLPAEGTVAVDVGAEISFVQESEESGVQSDGGIVQTPEKERKAELESVAAVDVGRLGESQGEDTVVEQDLGDDSDEAEHHEVPPTPLPGSFPEVILAPAAASSTSTGVALSTNSTAGPRLRTPRSALDIALAMQLRPGLGPGADPAWMVRFLMSMFGWFALLLSGQLE